jgi:peptidoglycan/LPS O-acetylase OafA/YrhL
VLRAFAFLLVALVHFSVPVWTKHIPDKGWIIDTVALGFIHTGWVGVPIFLFLSGYSLALGKCDPSYDLDKKQFFINRFLRIYPIWIVCILILTFNHKISGQTVFTLLLMQTQDIPPSTAFNIAWSIQLEWMCYLLFPVLLVAVSTRKYLLMFFAFFLCVRLFQYWLSAQVVMNWGYSTIFGGGTIFLLGIYTASMGPIRKLTQARIYTWLGIILLSASVVFIWKSGGYQAPRGRFIHLYFLFMPEILGGTMFLLMRGVTRRLAEGEEPARIPGLPGKAIYWAGRGIFRGFVHIGRVSYSAYMFSLFTLDFTQRFLAFSMHPSGWASLAFAFSLYLVALITFSTLSFYAIEMPFLAMRRRYISPHNPVTPQRGNQDQRHNQAQVGRAERTDAG